MDSEIKYKDGNQQEKEKIYDQNFIKVDYGKGFLNPDKKYNGLSFTFFSFKLIYYKLYENKFFSPFLNINESSLNTITLNN